ncbi:hypothetical protein ABW19_dt0207602 [Dactylella cylindrospora]|nr:hypothetical protein ABW19_dt0207602 [Dactylella cylindrospora]
MSSQYLPPEIQILIIENSYPTEHWTYIQVSRLWRFHALRAIRSRYVNPPLAPDHPPKLLKTPILVHEFFYQPENYRRACQCWNPCDNIYPDDVRDEIFKDILQYDRDPICISAGNDSIYPEMEQSVTVQVLFFDDSQVIPNSDGEYEYEDVIANSKELHTNVLKERGLPVPGKPSPIPSFKQLFEYFYWDIMDSGFPKEEWIEREDPSSLGKVKTLRVYSESSRIRYFEGGNYIMRFILRGYEEEGEEEEDEGEDEEEEEEEE